MPAWRQSDNLLAFHLAAGATLKEAAVSAGISESTARRRWANPAFRQRVVELRQEWIEACQYRLIATMAEAIDTLRELLHNSVPAVWLKAASVLLELGLNVGADRCPLSAGRRWISHADSGPLRRAGSGG